MGRVEFEEKQPGDDRAVVDVNDAFTNFSTQSTNVQAINVAQEALDDGSLADNLATSHFNTESGDGVTLLANTAYPGALGGAGNVINGINMAIGPVAIGADEQLRVKGAFDLDTITGGAFGIPVDSQLEIRFVTRIGGVPTAYPLSRMRKKTANEPGLYTQGMDGQIATTYWFDGPATFDTVELQFKLDAAGTYRANFGSVIGTLFKRMT